MDILEKLNLRYACKKFDASKKLSDEQLHVVKEALRLAPSSYGAQPYKYVIVENPQIRESLVEHSWGQQQVKDASHLLVLCYDTNGLNEAGVDSFIKLVADTRGQQPSDLQGYRDMIFNTANSMSNEAKENWQSRQIYIALGQLMTVLAVEGIDSCPMEGFVNEKYDEILGLNDKGLKSVVVIPVGFRSEEDMYSAAPKVRKPQEEIFETI